MAVRAEAEDFRQKEGIVQAGGIGIEDEGVEDGGDLPHEFEALGGGGRFEDDESGPPEVAVGGGAGGIILVDQEDGAAGLGGRQRGGRDGGEGELKDGAGAAGNFEGGGVGAGDGLDGGQAETAARLLGGEEGIEDAVAEFGRDPGAGVLHFEDDGLLAGEDAEGDVAAVRAEGLGGVDGEGAEGLAESGGIAADEGESGGQVVVQAAGAGDGSAKELSGIANEGGEVEGKGDAGAGAGFGEGLELAGEVDGFAGGGADLLQAVARGGIDFRPEEAELGVALDGGEEVVVIVGDTAQHGGEDLVGVDLSEAVRELVWRERDLGIACLKNEEAGGELAGIGGEGEEVPGSGFEDGSDVEGGAEGADGQDGSADAMGGTQLANQADAGSEVLAGPNDAEIVAVERPGGVVGHFDVMPKRMEGGAQRSAARDARIEEEDRHYHFPKASGRGRRSGTLSQKCTLLNHLMSRLWYFSLSIVLAAGAAAQAEEAADALAIVRKSVERDWFNFERARDYTYLQRTERRDLDERGNTVKTRSMTFEVIVLGGRPYRKLIAEDDRPLSEKKAQEVQTAFDRELEKRSRESEKEKRARAASEEKARREGRAFLREIPEAFAFSVVGEEQMDGLPVWVIDAKPKAGYRGKAKNWEMLKKFQGRIWITQGDYQWVRVEAETIAPVSFGWVLARLQPGARLTFQQRRVNDEVWLPVRAAMKLDARVALFKKYRAEIDVAWKEYRKFRADSRVVGAEELPDGKVKQ